MSIGVEDTPLSDKRPGPPRGSTPVLEPGDRVGRYLVLERLGAGGMGVVYSAYDPELDRKIAIKLLHPRPSAHPRPMERAYGEAMHRLFGDPPPEQAATPDPDQQRLLREAQATAQLTDPHVVTVHDVGEYVGQVFVAMEFVQGCTLRAWLAGQRRSWREIVDVLAKAGAGLAAAHAKGLVHRDFKPDNVMIGDDGRVVVMDFGLVRPSAELERMTTREFKPTTDALSLELTRDGAVIGTPAYMSPEQFLGKSADELSDQFSFSVTLWEALYGERPFRGDSLASLATAVTEGRRADSPREVDVPRAIERVVERGFANEPAERHPSMLALLAELARDPSRTRRRLVGAGAVLGLAAVGVGGWWIDRARKLAACTRDAEAIRDVWGPRARDEVEASMLASGAVYAETAFAKVSPWLDDYADTWATTRTDACEAIAFHPARRELARKTVACLDRRQARFASLVAELAEADATTTRKAVMIAAGLPPLAGCTDEAELARRPAADSQDPNLVALEDRLERASILQQAGRQAEARAEVEAVIATATEQEQREALATARYELGFLLALQGDYGAAERELTDAVFAAVELDDAFGMARAAVQLAYVMAYHDARPDDAAIWIRWARALVSRLGPDQHLMTASMNEKLALVAYQQGRYDDALELNTLALETREALLGPEHPEVSVTLNSRGIIETKHGSPKVALKTLERALAITEAALGGDHPDVAAMLTNIAQLQFVAGDHATARATMERAVAILEAVHAPGHPDLAKAQGNLGTVLQAQGDLEGALAVSVRAVTGLEATFGADHPNVAKTLVNLGIIERKLGRMDDAVTHHERALAIQVRALGPGHASLAEPHDALGEDLAALGKHEEALMHFREALVLLQATGKSFQEAVALFHVGREELACGRPEAAIEPLRRALALHDQHGLDASERELIVDALARAEAATR